MNRKIFWDNKIGGYIENITEDGEFTAVLKDESGAKSDIRVDFFVDEVYEEDRDLIKEGALIRCIELKNNNYIIFLHRFPVWEKDELSRESSVVKDFNNWLNSK